MSFFTRAVVGALKAFPAINAELDGEELVLKRYYDIGVAVSTDEGLVVPVLRDADRLTFAEIEQEIARLAQRARDRQLTLDDLQGGTFTITNGGVFGSLLSTPILNPPQVGILGMHKIEERPVALKGEVVVRPMMYVALTYDHRVVDGREAVSFLVRDQGADREPGDPPAGRLSAKADGATRGMTVHQFVPDHYHTAIGTYEPVLRIASGDTVETSTVDSGGLDKARESVTPGGNPQTGPFYVEGAAPGDVLAVRFDRVLPNRPWGRTSALVAPHVVDPGFVAELPRERGRGHWEIDVEQLDGHAGRAGDGPGAPDHPPRSDDGLLRGGPAAGAGHLLCHLRARTGATWTTGASARG